MIQYNQLFQEIQGGINVNVHESTPDVNSCNKCFFNEGLNSCNLKSIKCEASIRTDKKEVYFTKAVEVADGIKNIYL